MGLFYVTKEYRKEFFSAGRATMNLQVVGNKNRK